MWLALGGHHRPLQERAAQDGFIESKQRIYSENGCLGPDPHEWLTGVG